MEEAIVEGRSAIATEVAAASDGVLCRDAGLAAIWRVDDWKASRGRGAIRSCMCRSDRVVLLLEGSTSLGYPPSGIGTAPAVARTAGERSVSWWCSRTLQQAEARHICQPMHSRQVRAAVPYFREPFSFLVGYFKPFEMASPYASTSSILANTETINPRMAQCASTLDSNLRFVPTPGMKGQPDWPEIRRAVEQLLQQGSFRRSYSEASHSRCRVLSRL